MDEKAGFKPRMEGTMRQVDNRIRSEHEDKMRRVWSRLTDITFKMKHNVKPLCIMTNVEIKANETHVTQYSVGWVSRDPPETLEAQNERQGNEP